jgi:hypothetical protein
VVDVSGQHHHRGRPAAVLPGGDLAEQVAQRPEEREDEPRWSKSTARRSFSAARLPWAR